MYIQFKFMLVILYFGLVVYLLVVFLFIVFFRGALEKLGRVPCAWTYQHLINYPDILLAAK